MRRNFHTLLLHPVRAPATGGAPPCTVAPSHPAGIPVCVYVCFSPASAGGKGWQFIPRLIRGVTEWRRFRTAAGRWEKKKILRRANKLSKGRCIVCTRAKRAARDHSEHLPKSEPLANNVVKVFWEGG